MIRCFKKSFLTDFIKTLWLKTNKSKSSI